MLIESTVIVAVIVALVKVVKSTKKVSNNYLPAIAVGLGVVLTFLANISLIKDAWASLVIIGLVSGLTACGFYDNIVAPIKEVKARKEMARLDRKAQDALNNLGS